MRKPLVIMLSGYLKSGKDVVGKHLCNAHGFVRFAFADLLKHQVSERFNLSRADLDTQNGKDALVGGRTVRSLLIEHGQLRRKQNANYWVESVLEKLKMSDCKRAVITDWRFPNEYTRLAEQATVQSWRIDRWGVPPLVDETETALDLFPFDTRIDNIGSLEELCGTVDKLAPPAYLLVDIDGVLLRWADGFRQFLQARGYTFTSEYPVKCDMTGWVSAPSVPNFNELVVSFNHSPDFATLASYEDAQSALKALKNRFAKCIVIAISSCGDDGTVVENRRRNINAQFEGLVDDIICLRLESSKLETLRKYPPSVWVDDNDKNVLDGASVGHDAFLFSRPWTRGQIEGDAALQRVVSWDEVIGKV